MIRNCLIRGFKLLGTSKVLKYIFCNIESFCIVALFVRLTSEIIQCWLDKCFWKVIFYYWTFIVQLSKCHYCRDTAIFWVPILKVKHWVPRRISDSLLSRMFENKKRHFFQILEHLWKSYDFSCCGRYFFQELGPWPMCSCLCLKHFDLVMF